MTPHGDRTPTEHGFASLFETPRGLGLVWLDGRAMQPGSHGGHGPGGQGTMALRATGFDGAWKQAAETVVDARVCECCPTSAAVTADGPIVAFRNRTDQEIRDIHVSRLENGKWSESKAVHDDGWKIAACPVNGPMLGARGREVVVAWFTGREEQGRAFVAFSRDAGRSFGAPIRLDAGGTLGRVDVELLADGSAIASWIEFGDGRAQLRARRIERSGAASPAITVAALAGSRASGYPRIAAHGAEVVFAWTDSVQGQTQVKTAAARLR